MRKIGPLALLLSLLLCASRGRRVHVSTERMQSERQGRHALALLLVTQNPTVAFNPSGLGARFLSGSSVSSSSVWHKLHRLHHRDCSMSESDARDSIEQDVLGSNSIARFGDWAYEVVSGVAKTLAQGLPDLNQERRVNLALRRMQRDLTSDDKEVSSEPMLPLSEKIILNGALASIVIGFFVRGPVQTLVFDYITPTLTIMVASIGFRSEYIGKFKVAQSKEIMATSKMAAAQGEVFLSRAERVKAIMGICLGASAVFAALALVLEPIQGLATEAYLVCPTITVLAAAVAALAEQETRTLTGRAIGIGSRRFASANRVDRTWLSKTEQVDRVTEFTTRRWVDFAIGFVLGPITGIFVPGTISFKAVVVSALAAAQVAWYLAQAEGLLAQAQESVAIKSRAASVCETYAMQGSRNGAILVYTSAICGMCAAVADFLHVAKIMPSLALSGPAPWCGPLLFSIFPAVGALVAAASSISKSRCDLNSEITSYGATRLAEGEERTPNRSPFEVAIGLIRITLLNAVTAAQARLRKLFEDMERSLKGTRESDATLTSA